MIYIVGKILLLIAWFVSGITLILSKVAKRKSGGGIMTKQELEGMIEELRDKGESLEIELDTIQDEIMIYETMLANGNYEEEDK